MQELASSLSGASVCQTKPVLLQIQQVPITHFNRKIWLVELYQRLHPLARYSLSLLGANAPHIQAAFQTHASECRQTLSLPIGLLWHGGFKNQRTIIINTCILTKFLYGESQTNNQHCTISKQSRCSQDCVHFH